MFRSCLLLSRLLERFCERGGRLLTQVVRPLNTLRIGMLVGYNEFIWARHGRPWTVQASCNFTNVLENHTSSAFMECTHPCSERIDMQANMFHSYFRFLRRKRMKLLHLYFRNISCLLPQARVLRPTKQNSKCRMFSTMPENTTRL